MKRRALLQQTGLLLAGVIIGMPLLHSRHRSPLEPAQTLGSRAQLDFLNEVGETILPKTDTPGAKEAKVGEFMAVIVNDCYSPGDQAIFIGGMAKLEKRCKGTYEKSFMDCNVKQRTELLAELDKEGVDYFKMMKNLTLTGFYTSEIGATQFLSYSFAPGRYDGCTSVRPW